MLIDLLLGGDNAVVIAMACRKLPPERQKKAIVRGTAGAVVARIVLLVIAVYLLSVPWLKIVGALIGWIAGSMLVTDPAILKYTAAIHSQHIIAGITGAMLIVLYGVVRNAFARRKS